MIIVTLTDFVDRSGFLVYSIEEIGEPEEGGSNHEK